MIARLHGAGRDFLGHHRQRRTQSTRGSPCPIKRILALCITMSSSTGVQPTRWQRGMRYISIFACGQSGPLSLRHVPTLTSLLAALVSAACFRFSPFFEIFSAAMRYLFSQSSRTVCLVFVSRGPCFKAPRATASCISCIMLLEALLPLLPPSPCSRTTRHRTCPFSPHFFFPFLSRRWVGLGAQRSS